MADRRDGSKRCIIEYDGASKGNPGRSGGGAVIRDADNGTTIRVREGLGYKTNNEAEYKALTRGLEVARDHGYEDVIVRGDSQLVHRQLTGQYRVRNPNLRNLHKDVQRLCDKFRSFRTEHAPRDYNHDADKEANRGSYFREGEVEVEYSSEGDYYSSESNSYSDSD